jgi:signal transduction histidine kinase
MGTCTDIHEQKRARDELLASNRRKDDFLAMLAHELRNPLAPISTAAQLLKAAPSDPARVQRSADIIDRQVRHMTELVDDLLDVSRVTRGLVELDRRPVEMKTVLAHAIEQVRPLVESRGHELTMRMPPDDVQVLGDRPRLVQVVSNLLTNAAKYTPPDGALSVSMAVGEEVEIRVADNGTGIEPELLPHVFELFTQGARTPDRAQGGLGLGLALVKSLVELHGGQVAALSPPLPRASRRLRVLVVDDNKDAAETLGLLLETLGHEVHVAHDSASALEAAKGGAFDAYVLDIGLPGMDGFVLARQLRAEGSGVAATFIALTGYGGSDDRHRGQEAGFDHYLVKPADAAELATLLQR